MSCLTRAAHNIPGILGRACSPPTTFLRSPVKEINNHMAYTSQIPPDYVPSFLTSQANPPSISKRTHARSECSNPGATKENSDESKQKPDETPESYSLRSRLSLQSSNRSFNSLDRNSNPRRSVQSKKQSSLSSNFVVSTQPHYYQPHFDISHQSSSQPSAQQLIEGK